MKHAIIYNFFKNYKEGDIIKINPAEIQKIPELQNVFRIDLDVKNRVKDDMAVNGFSKGHPVHVFKWEIDGKEVLVLCDGYTRLYRVKELTDKQILLLGAKYALIQIAKGKSATEILNTNMFPDAIKATDITFDKDEIELLKEM